VLAAVAITLLVVARSRRRKIASGSGSVTGLPLSGLTTSSIAGHRHEGVPLLSNAVDFSATT